MPYLFVLCLERLGQWITRKVEEDTWKPLRASRGGPCVSHLFFADDLILFGAATIEQARCMKKGLEDFFQASGQKVSFSKSPLFVSPNIHQRVAEDISMSLGIPLTANLSRYLGHHLMHRGRSSCREGELV